MATRICTMPGCERKHYGHGFCRRHYSRLQRWGSPEGGRAPLGTPAEQRFWAKVDFSGPCWEWTAYRRDGYGMFTPHRISATAHRYAWELLVGPIPNGLHLDHLCRNTACVNPDHLEPVTPRENLLRGYSPSVLAYRGGRCGKGHPHTPENSYVTPRGWRRCRVCANASHRARRAALKAAAEGAAA